MSQSAVALSKHICLQQRLKMFVADVKCPWAVRQTVQIRGPTAPKLLSPKLRTVLGIQYRATGRNMDSTRTLEAETIR